MTGWPAALALAATIAIAGPGSADGGVGLADTRVGSGTATGADLPASAQDPVGEPLEVRFRVDAAPSDDAVRVTGTYRLRLDAGAERIPLLGLHFLGARVEGLVGTLDGTRLAWEPRTEEDSPLFAGNLRLPRPEAANGERMLTLSYEVRGANRIEGDAFDLVVPVLVVDWPPTVAPPDMFGARVSVPVDYHIASSFPTVDRDSERSDGVRVESFRLQVTPSVIRYRGTVGEAPLLTRGRVVDLGVGLFLLGMVVWGLVRWRQSLRDAEPHG